MERIHDFPFFAVDFDRQGTLIHPSQPVELREHIATAKPSDLIFIAHGWRNSSHDARDLYTSFLGTLRTNIDRSNLSVSLTGRTFAVAGVFWPSKPFPEHEEDPNIGGVVSLRDSTEDEAEVRRMLDELDEEQTGDAQRRAIAAARELLPKLEGSQSAQDEFVDQLMVLLNEAEPDPNEGLERVRATPGHELFDKLAGPIVVPRDTEDSCGIMAVPDGSFGDGAVADFGDVFTGIWHRVGRVLNYTTWYLMKDLAGTVGIDGIAPLIRAIAADLSASRREAMRIHLVGHSLGGRLVAGSAKALAKPPVLRIGTLTLLQAAFSHYGLAKNNGDGVAGFFRDVIDQGVVRGPILATHSRKDVVVGKTYALASRLAGDNVKEIGDERDPFGGIGRNGAQRTAEREMLMLGPAGESYQWKAGRVHNMRGDHIIKDHSDVKGAEITYAFASALVSV